MWQLILVMLCIVLQSCNEPMVELGQPLIIKDTETKKIFIPSGELVVKVDTTINQVDYTLGIKNSLIVFISTIDGRATGVEGITGKQLSQLKAVSKSSLKKINGWGYYLSIGNGWFAGFRDAESITNGKRPDWYFRYNFPKANKDKFKSISNG